MTNEQAIQILSNYLLNPNKVTNLSVSEGAGIFQSLQTCDDMIKTIKSQQEQLEEQKKLLADKDALISKLQEPKAEILKR